MTEPHSNNFAVGELRCRCDACKKQVPNQCNQTSVHRLQRVRDRFHAKTGKGLSLSSAYRCENHPEEVAKREKYGDDYKGGQHYQGTAFDIRIGWGAERQLLIRLAIEEGFTGFGYANSFLHIDDGHSVETSWAY